MTDNSPRLRAAFKYMIYGKSDTFDVDRIIDMLQAFEKFVAVKGKFYITLMINDYYIHNNTN